MKVKDSTGSSYVQRDQKVMPFTRGVLFSWNLHNQTDTTTVPSAEVLLYRAADIFDDRFQSLDESQENNADSDLLTIKLGLAQEWMYECKGDGDIDAFHCKHASLMKRVLLKHGTYVYLYKINGSLHLNSDDKVTTLATQRRVHYVDVKQDDEQFSYQGNYLLDFHPFLLEKQVLLTMFLFIFVAYVL